MQITLLRAKLHRACVTHVQQDLEGSCTIDGDLMDLAGLHDYEQVQIYNVDNGERFTTYAVRGEHGSRMVAVRGAAAHRAATGDRIIICAYGIFNTAELHQFRPALVYCDEQNDVTGSRNVIPIQMLTPS